MSNHVLRCIDIRPGILSDHCIVNFEMTLFATTKGPGLWRFNNSLLEDDTFVRWVKTEIGKVKASSGIYGGVNDLGLLLEMLSGEIRAHSVLLSKQKTKQRREQDRRAIDELNVCELEMCSNPTDDNITSYKELKAQVEEIEQEKGLKAIVDSRETDKVFFWILCK